MTSGLYKTLYLVSFPFTGLYDAVLFFFTFLVLQNAFQFLIDWRKLTLLHRFVEKL